MLNLFIVILVGLLPCLSTATPSKKIQVYTIETPPTVVKTGEGINGLSGTFGKVIARAIKKSGKEKEFEVVWVPWKRALLDLERNPQALFFPFTRTFEREYKVNWVVHLADVDCWLYAVDPKVSVHDFKDLAKYRIGVLGGSAREQELRRYVGNSSKIEGMTEDLSNYRKLQTGRIDIWATHPAVMAEAQKMMQAKGQTIREFKALKKLFTQSMWMVGNRDMSDQNRNLVQSVFGWGVHHSMKPPPMTGGDFLNGALL